MPKVYCTVTIRKYIEIEVKEEQLKKYCKEFEGVDFSGLSKEEKEDVVANYFGENEGDLVVETLKGEGDLVCVDHMEVEL